MTTTDDDGPDGRRPPPGHHWEWRIDLQWRTIPADVDRRCRYGASPGHPACGERAVAEMNRKRHRRWRDPVDSWWAYCGRHLYGRRIASDTVWTRFAVPNPPEAQ